MIFFSNFGKLFNSVIDMSVTCKFSNNSCKQRYIACHLKSYNAQVFEIKMAVCIDVYMHMVKLSDQKMLLLKH